MLACWGQRVICIKKIELLWALGHQERGEFWHHLVELQRPLKWSPQQWWCSTANTHIWTCQQMHAFTLRWPLSQLGPLGCIPVVAWKQTKVILTTCDLLFAVLHRVFSLLAKMQVTWSQHVKITDQTVKTRPCSTCLLSLATWSTCPIWMQISCHASEAFQDQRHVNTHAPGCWLLHLFAPCVQNASLKLNHTDQTQIFLQTIVVMPCHSYFTTQFPECWSIQQTSSRGYIKQNMPHKQLGLSIKNLCFSNATSDSLHTVYFLFSTF